MLKLIMWSEAWLETIAYCSVHIKRGFQMISTRNTLFSTGETEKIAMDDSGAWDDKVWAQMTPDTPPPIIT